MKNNTGIHLKYPSLRRSLPVLLILACPPSVMLFWYALTGLNGSVTRLADVIINEGPVDLLYRIWGPVFFGTPRAWMIIGVFALSQLAMMRLVPGRAYQGPVTPAGNIPVYKDNGLASYGVTLTLFCVLSFGFHVFSPSIIYDHFNEILGALNFTSLVFCLLLYVKGRFYPSSSDSGYTGNFIFDYYWGTELYPRVLGWDVKMFTNCRFGMMGWPLIIISFAAGQHELYGLSDSMMVAVGLQLIYITKFFIWESGYMRSMDIMHDRAGFYICWGCLVWLPMVYTSHTLYLVNHPNRLGLPLAALIFVFGTASIIINYLADRQRQVVRASAGDCTIWGKKPVLLRARYRTENGEDRENLLLASGWWGLSRHFHYIPEITGAFFWTVPALFENFLPYFYVSFLAILLVHRSVRDDRRCSTKYGKDWDAYRALVPHRILPLPHRRKK